MDRAATQAGLLAGPDESANVADALHRITLSQCRLCGGQYWACAGTTASTGDHLRHVSCMRRNGKASVAKHLESRQAVGRQRSLQAV